MLWLSTSGTLLRVRIVYGFGGFMGFVLKVMGSILKVRVSRNSFLKKTWYFKRIMKLRTKFDYVFNGGAWLLNKNRVYTINSGYSWLQEAIAKYLETSIIWGRSTCLRIHFVYEELRLESLPTKDKLQKMQFRSAYLLCPLCLQWQEIYAHLFFSYPKSYLTLYDIITSYDCTYKLQNLKDKKKIYRKVCYVKGGLFSLILSAMTYNLWTEGNNRILTQKENTMQLLMV